MNSDDDVRQKTGSTHGMTERRINRFRRWLAYKLLPGTNEFDVALTRQRALRYIAHSEMYLPDTKYWEEDTKETYDQLKDEIPVRSEWDLFEDVGGYK